MDGQYVRAASLFVKVADRLVDDRFPGCLQLALRDLRLFEGAMADAARWTGITVADLDTSPGEVPARFHRRNDRPRGLVARQSDHMLVCIKQAY
jgi:hypothetical protein